MEVTSSKLGDHSLIKVLGEVDALSAITLDNHFKEVLKTSKGHVLVDCGDLKYISSAGLGVFMSHLKEIENNGHQFVIFGLNQEVYSTFEILGLHHIIKIEKNLTDALKHC